MAQSKLPYGNSVKYITPPKEIFRVIDDGTCVLTTLDARKALLSLIELLDKHGINHCWADVEVLK